MNAAKTHTPRTRKEAPEAIFSSKNVELEAESLDQSKEIESEV